MDFSSTLGRAPLRVSGCIRGWSWVHNKGRPAPRAVPPITARESGDKSRRNGSFTVPFQTFKDLFRHLHPTRPSFGPDPSQATNHNPESFSQYGQRWWDYLLLDNGTIFIFKRYSAYRESKAYYACNTQHSLLKLIRDQLQQSHSP